MEVHKPKPVRNWREMLAEIGVIVLSVCIALAAEQAVEWWHWKNRVRDAAEAMRLELRDDDGPQAYARVAMVNCFARQLDAIQTAIEAGRPRKEIIALVDFYRPIAPTWDSNAWNAVLASDVGSHIPATQMMNWSKPYNFVPSLDKRNAQELENRAALLPTHREGEKLSPAEAETMLAAIARLREDNIGVAGRSRALLISMRDAGITMGQDQQNFALKALRARFHACVSTPSLTAPRPSRVFPNVVMPGSLYHMGN
jgi:hypothetical protein